MRDAGRAPRARAARFVINSTPVCPIAWHNRCISCVTVATTATRNGDGDAGQRRQTRTPGTAHAARAAAAAGFRAPEPASGPDAADARVGQAPVHEQWH